MAEAIRLANEPPELEQDPPQLEQPPQRRRRKRTPSIATMIKRAEKSGREVTSVTLPDGTRLHFGECEPSEANNPWLADMKATKQ